MSLNTDITNVSNDEIRVLSEGEVDHVSGGIAFAAIFGAITAGIGAVSAGVNFYKENRNWFDNAARDVGRTVSSAARSVGRFFSSLF